MMNLTDIKKLALLEMYRSKHFNDMDWEDETNDDLYYKVCNKIYELEDKLSINNIVEIEKVDNTIHELVASIL